MRCMVCGKKFSTITPTHLRKHDMTVAEYKKKFGVEVTVDPEVGRKISRKNKGRINVGEKNAAKRPEVRKQISSTVTKLWESGIYSDRINGMLGQFGEKSPQWKAEVHTPTYLAEHDYYSFLQNFQDVSTCIRCGKTDRKINVHHVDETHKNFLISNLEPLCVPCHSLFHYGRFKQPFITIGRRFSFDAAHFLPGYKGKCANFHGHRWEVEVGIMKRIDGDTGMVFDFSKLKQLVTTHILDLCDHQLLNDIMSSPTAENLAVWIWEQLMFKALLKGISFVKVYESPESFAKLTSEGMLSMFTSNIEDYLVRYKRGTQT